MAKVKCLHYVTQIRIDLSPPYAAMLQLNKQWESCLNIKIKTMPGLLLVLIHRSQLNTSKQ